MFSDILSIIKSKPVKLFTAIITIVSFFIIVGTVYAIGTLDSGFRVNNGTYIDVPVMPCQRVTNNSGSNIFIPTKDPSEWNAFSSHLPAGVSVCACNAGQFCSGYNSCGQTWNGIVLCNGMCSDPPKPESNCGWHLTWTGIFGAGGTYVNIGTLGCCGQFGQTCAMSCVKGQYYWHIGGNMGSYWNCLEICE